MDIFVPDIYQKSIYFINYEKLFDDGIKCLLFDLDNTCVPYKVKEANDKLMELFEKLKLKYQKNYSIYNRKKSKKNKS